MGCALGAAGSGACTRGCPSISPRQALRNEVEFALQLFLPLAHFVYLIFQQSLQRATRASRWCRHLVTLRAQGLDDIGQWLGCLLLGDSFAIDSGAGVGVPGQTPESLESIVAVAVVSLPASLYPPCTAPVPSTWRNRHESPKRQRP